MDSAEHGIPCLPPEVVTHVLRYVQRMQRLCSCALVSRSWQTAAAAATTTIAINHLRETTVSSLEIWLQRSGSHVTALNVTKPTSRETLQLPFGQLQELQHLSLEYVQLSGGPASNTSTSSSNNSTTSDPHRLGALTNLTSLQLEDVSLPSDEYLAPLSALTNLRHLQLVDIYSHNLSACGAHVGTALANLTRLTHLTMEKRDEPFVELAAVTALSCLQQLRELKLASTALTAASCAQLPLSLTLLSLEELHEWQLSSSSTPRLAQLTGLKELTVLGHWRSETCIYPEVLSSLVQLQRLTLTSCSFA